MKSIGLILLIIGGLIALLIFAEWLKDGLLGTPGRNYGNVFSLALGAQILGVAICVLTGLWLLKRR